jgi:hypothetical protein
MATVLGDSADNEELLNVIKVSLGPGTAQPAAAWPS